MFPFFSASENQILGALLSHRVRFVIVGGAAVQHHGHERPRDDLDVLLEPNPQNAVKFAAALKSCGMDLTAAQQERIGRPDPPLQMRLNSRYSIDVSTSIFAVPVADAIAAAELVHCQAGAVPFLSKGHLIANKRARADAKDLADVEAIESRPA
jgi:hypothetical protein